MAEHVAPPPYSEELLPNLPGYIASYDSSEPSAPPQEFVAPYYSQLDSEQTQPLITGESSEQDTISPSSSRPDRLVDKYVSYSIAHHLRKHIEPRTSTQDPELDVEAQFGREAVRNAQTAIRKKQQRKCITGWLWCAGVVIVPFYVIVPLVMLIIGIVGIGKCPFRNDTLVIYLIGGGSIAGLMLITRLLPSVLTCVTNRKWCRKTKTSTRIICSIETLFYAVLAVNLIALVLGTYTTFVEPRPPSCSVAPGPECCDTLVYVSSATVTVVQYILLATTGLFVCLVLACVRCLDNKVSS